MSALPQRKVHFLSGRAWFTREIAESLGLGELFGQISSIRITATLDGPVECEVELLAAKREGVSG